MTQKLIHLILFIFLSVVCFAQQTEDYDWANVPIGGGGYITGMKIHPLDADLRYYRTDVGGAYRWDAAQGKLVQLIYSTNKKHYSVAGIALHPTDLDIVYIAVSGDCNSSNTAIYKSADRGETFTVVTGLPFYFAANGGRNCDTNGDNNAPNTGDKDREGTPIEVNPLNTNELYIGTREKGLYIMNIQNDTWVQVPNNQIPHNTEVYSIRTIKFHPTQAELVYIAYMGYGVFRGNTNTQVYERLDAIGNAALDAALDDAMDIAISKDGDYMLVACKNSGVLKAANITSNTVNWSASPIGNNIAKGYLTVECSPHDNNTAVTVAAGWNQISNIETTTDAGVSWQTTTHTLDMAQHIFPWRYSAFGNNVAQFGFDPVNVNKLHFTSWFSTFSSDNWTSVNGGTWHTQNAYGHEEIVPTDLITFNPNQVNRFLMCGSGDHSGMLFDDLTEFNYATETVTDNFSNPAEIGMLKKSASMDFCFNNSDHLAVALTEEWSNSNGGIAKSSDGGQSWALLSDYNSTDGKSIIAIASQDPNDLVMLTENGLKYTNDNGVNVDPSVGVTSMAANCSPSAVNCLGATNINSGSINNSVFSSFRNVAADRSLDCVFYYYDWNGDFSISTDSGQNWCIINTTDLPASNDIWQKARITSIPNQAGHLWFNINKKLFHSSDGGVNWTEIISVNDVLALGSGVGENVGDYDALYIFGSIDNISGNYVYRSTDMGTTWVQINNHGEKELWGDIKIITGDRNEFGKIYATSSGQGVLYGETASTNNCPPVELLTKGNFDDLNNPDIPDWNFQTLGAATADAFIDNLGNAVIDIINAGVNDYDVQLRQDNFGMVQDQYYLLTVDAKSTTNRSFNIKLRNRTNGSLTYFEEPIELTNNIQKFAFVFRAPVSDPDLRIVLLFGGDTNDVLIDAIGFQEYCLDHPIDNINCPAYLTINDQDVYPQSYGATELIISNGIVKSNSNVLFKSNKEILLKPGFCTEVNAVFEAIIQNCN